MAVEYSTTRPLLRVIGWPLAATGLCLLLAAGMPGPASAEAMTSEQAEAILAELRQIRQLLERQQGAQVAEPDPAHALSVSVAGAHALGRDDAPITMVEFTDYECPFCREFHQTTFEKLKTAYIDTGQVRFVSRDMPLPMHQHAIMAAEAARCAGDQGKYWQARHAVMATPGELSAEAIMKAMRSVGADEALVKACLESRKYQPAVQKDLADAQAAGLTGTPSFVLGRGTSDPLRGELIVGAQPYAVFDAKIREILGTSK